MATSGTVATTVIDTATVLEHAFRRVRLPLSKQTPENVDIAKQNLYLLLLGLVGRGLNLWCLETALVGLVAGKPTYVMPAGTVDVLNVVHSVPQMVANTFSSIANGGKANITATSIVRVGFVPAADFTGALTIASSADDISYTTRTTTPATSSYTAGLWHWVDLPTSVSAAWFKITATGLTLTDIAVASSVQDLPVMQWNRDTYSVINNKRQSGTPATNYYLEKLLTPQITLWPVPTVSTNHLTLFLHRQIQDVGTLTQQLELPQRWVEAIIWQLAYRLAFEVPDVDPALVQIVKPAADETLLQAENDETDGAPIRITPNIRGYTA
jgi:hypothetical protein